MKYLKLCTTEWWMVISQLDFFLFYNLGVHFSQKVIFSKCSTAELFFGKYMFYESDSCVEVQISSLRKKKEPDTHKK